MVCISLDHRLRAESAQEVQTIRGWFDARGIEHASLSVDWGSCRPHSGRVQQEARQRRHELLTKECERRGLRYLLYAHTLDDQVETMLLRLARASGLEGLSGMKSVVPAAMGSAVLRVRPLLGVPKAALYATCGRFGQDWLEDPSNRMLVFDRVRVRQALAVFGRPQVTASDPTLAVQRSPISLEEFGVVVDSLRRLSRYMSDFVSARLRQLATFISPFGYCVVRVDTLLSVEGVDVATSVIAQALKLVRGGQHLPLSRSFAHCY